MAFEYAPDEIKTKQSQPRDSSDAGGDAPQARDRLLDQANQPEPIGANRNFAKGNGSEDKVVRVAFRDDTPKADDKAKADPSTLAKPGDVVTPNGDFKRREIIKVGGQDFIGYRVHKAGSLPSADDIQVPFPQSDGSKPVESIMHLNSRRQIYGVEGFDKDGRQIKKYVLSPDGKQMAEVDPGAGNLTMWTKRKEGDTWDGKQIRENGKPVDKEKGVRENLRFNHVAELLYKDDKGDRHLEHKDGKTEILKVLPDGAYNIIDEKGRLNKAGVVNSKGPDFNNYLAYKYNDDNAADDTPVITQIDRIYKGKAETLWTPDTGEDAKLLANGEFAYRTDDGSKIVISPDQSIRKYIMNENIGPSLLSEISYPDGSKRSFTYGKPANLRQPTEIESSFLMPNGDTKISKLSLMPPVVGARASDKPEAANGAENEESKKNEDPLLAVQLWQRTEEKISADGIRSEILGAKGAPFFGLELLSNGDFETTSTSTDNSRYLFPSRGIAAFPTGIAVPLEGSDGRILRAEQYFNSVYAKYVLPQERESMSPRQTVAGRLVDTNSIEDDPKLVSLFALDYMTNKDKLNMPIPQVPNDISGLSKEQLAQVHTDIAYKYELAAAIIEGREALKRKRLKASN